MKFIINSNLKENIERIKKKADLKSQKLTFYEIIFRHVDVMGSGRFLYAEKKKAPTELCI